MTYYIEKILLFIIIAIIATAVLLFVERHKAKKELSVVVRHIFMAVFFAYIYIMSDMTLIDSRHVYRERMIDLTPFNSLIHIFDNENPRETEILLLNIIMLTPFGMLFPFVFQKHFRLTIPMGLLYGFMIEFLQLIFIRGVFEIDVIIYRLIGVTVGYLFYRILISFRKKRLISTIKTTTSL